MYLNTVYLYMLLYTPVQSCIPLYTPVYPVYPCIPLYILYRLVCCIHIRLRNSRVLCERERRSIFERKVWSECKNGEGEWGEMLNTAVRFFTTNTFKITRSSFFQQRKIPFGLILTATFHQMLITPRQKDIDAISFS